MTLLISLATLSLALLGAGAQAQIPPESSQLVITVTDSWDADSGHMYTFRRDQGRWKAASIATPVNVGRNGLAWGLGLHPAQSGKQKREGDGRAPAGIFALDGAFGYLPSVKTGLDYQQMNAGHYCIDVTGSPLYNQTVDAGEVGQAAVAGSSEGMRRDIHYGDQLYRKGIFVAHNPHNRDGAGSCIFMHLWKDEGVPTAGCTSMAEPVMDRLLGWLDAAEHPVYVALPRAEYERLRKSWSLPDIEGE
ncbi:L,D-transpeptidase family protein [Microbulbifer hainanensis]|uniref:L,D-transpeptidase family protein n=1 Tax=Microbulbifer hainanensis TaxID=2735675 RepID=UPI001D034E23|nr:hypothetical protein [Microbulbifer hainanensis]